MSDTQHNPNFTYRPDIDGLRAIAILLVVIFHAYPKFLRGGFIGVDIFFVISGYLITSIILKQQSQNNFSLLDFYSRRIKRIFPSLIVVLTFALVAGWYILLENEYELLGKHIAAGSVYISNFVLQSESGYFDIDSELKPLLHLWSLAIEEQFYLAFPLLLILGGRFRVNPLVIIATCLGVSFLLNVIQIDDKPTEVFFFPTSRAWELLVGSLIAYLSIHSIGKKHAEQFSNWLAWFGVLLIFTAWIFLNSKTILFPSWWALMPTIGAASLIFAGETAWFNRKILASKVAVFIGLISYPLYLWHWVLLSFIRITEIEKPSSTIRLLVVLVSFVLAWLTFQFVEKSIRFQKSKFISLGLLTILLLIGVSGLIIESEKGYGNRKPITELSTVASEEIKPNKNDSLIKTADAMPSCLSKYKDFSHDSYCLLNDSTKESTTILIGDSHANHLYYGLSNVGFFASSNLLHLGKGGCFPFFDNPINNHETCRGVIDNALEIAISTDSIDTIILSGRAITELNENMFKQKISVSNFLKTGSVKTEKEDPYFFFEAGMKKTLNRLIATNKKIIFVLDTPDIEFRPTACEKRPWRLSGDLVKFPCAIKRSQVDERRQKYLEIVFSILKEFPEVNVWDTLPTFCDAEYCWAMKDGEILYRDSDHLNVAGSFYLAKQFHTKLANEYTKN
ncbi:MAG: acyltransferase family protein [Methylococcaceae bacterium]